MSFQLFETHFQPLNWTLSAYTIVNYSVVTRHWVSISTEVEEKYSEVGR